MKFRGLGAALVAAALLWAAPALATSCQLTNGYVLRDGNVPQALRNIWAIIKAYPDCSILPANTPVDTNGVPTTAPPGTTTPSAQNVQGGGPTATPVNITPKGNTATNGDGIVTGGATAVAVSAPGGSASHSYAPGDTATLTGGTETSNGVVTVTHTQVVSATVGAGGTGGTNGTQTVTGTTGTGTPFQASVTVAGNAITAVLSISVAGNYTANPSSLTAEPVTGASLTGAQLSVVMGALTASVTAPGLYSAVPSNPVSQGSASGAGLSATFTMTFAPIAQALFGGVTPMNGFKVGDPNSADDVWISDATTTPVINGASSTRVFANGGQYSTEPGEKPVGPVYLIGTAIGDRFNARSW